MQQNHGWERSNSIRPDQKGAQGYARLDLQFLALSLGLLDLKRCWLFARRRKTNPGSCWQLRRRQMQKEK
jgi:hypothetical protein